MAEENTIGYTHGKPLLHSCLVAQLQSCLEGLGIWIQSLLLTNKRVHSASLCDCLSNHTHACRAVQSSNKLTAGVIWKGFQDAISLDLMEKQEQQEVWREEEKKTQTCSAMLPASQYSCWLLEWPVNKAAWKLPVIPIAGTTASVTSASVRSAENPTANPVMNIDM